VCQQKQCARLQSEAEYADQVEFYPVGHRQKPDRQEGLWLIEMIGLIGPEPSLTVGLPLGVGLRLGI
jgi:hypothetical protein